MRQAQRLVGQVIVSLLFSRCFCSQNVAAAFSFHQGPSRTTDNAAKSDISFDVLKEKEILVVGGGGRVGGSVVTQLIKRGAGRVTVGGTSMKRFEASKKRWQSVFTEQAKSIQDKVDFAVVDREQEESMASLLSKNSYDIVVHTAGPFQGKVKANNGVLEACVMNNVPYCDVCDDYFTASAAKARYATKAEEMGVPCLLSTGCWPGVSSLMAKQLVGKVISEKPNLKPEDLTVDFSFFTAGSGGAGATLLVATFLILAEEALTVVDRRRRPAPAMKDYSTINFGKIIGDRDVAHLNLLETASIHDILGCGNVKALFGTAPNFWNALLGLMAQLPSSLLSNEDLMGKLAIFSLPIVRIVDHYAGATNAMRCDVVSDNDDNLRATAIYGHENLEPCVGECVTAFVCSILAGGVRPGVWFTEEGILGASDTAAVLGLASVGAHTLEVDSTIGLSQEEVWGGSETRVQVGARLG